jgi:hypothetical protein
VCIGVTAAAEVTTLSADMQEKPKELGRTIRAPINRLLGREYAVAG